MSVASIPDIVNVIESDVAIPPNSTCSNSVTCNCERKLQTAECKWFDCQCIGVGGLDHFLIHNSLSGTVHIIQLYPLY